MLRGEVRHHRALFRLVTLLLLAWILGDMVGTGLCPGDVDPCAGSPGHERSREGLPHGQHSGMATIHVGHCLCHGLVTLSHTGAVAATLEPLQVTANSTVCPIAPGVPPPVYHPPQLSA